MATFHVVQTFSRGKRGVIVPDLPRQVHSAELAKGAARRALATSGKVGAVAFSRSGDPVTGDWDEAVVLSAEGDLPAEIYEQLEG